MNRRKAALAGQRQLTQDQVETRLPEDRAQRPRTQQTGDYLVTGLPSMAHGHWLGTQKPWDSPQKSSQSLKERDLASARVVWLMEAFSHSLFLQTKTPTGHFLLTRTSAMG